jgi:hypothetical protein
MQVWYNAIEIKQIKKLNVSSIFLLQDHIFLVCVSGIQTKNFKKMFVDFYKKCLISIFINIINIKINNFKRHNNIYSNS